MHREGEIELWNKSSQIYENEYPWDRNIKE
jgi:hypothetical protein